LTLGCQAESKSDPGYYFLIPAEKDSAPSPSRATYRQVADSFDSHPVTRCKVQNIPPGTQ
jgi:hypothetical protein